MQPAPMTRTDLRPVYQGVPIFQTCLNAPAASRMRPKLQGKSNGTEAIWKNVSEFVPKTEQGVRDPAADSYFGAFAE